VVIFYGTRAAAGLRNVLRDEPSWAPYMAFRVSAIDKLGFDAHITRLPAE
jgi:hypothetical protein